MASKIYEHAKSMTSISHEDATEMWEQYKSPSEHHVMPIIAKGNVFQGIVAQW